MEVEAVEEVCFIRQSNREDRASLPLLQVATVAEVVAGVVAIVVVVATKVVAATTEAVATVVVEEGIKVAVVAMGVEAMVSNFMLNALFILLKYNTQQVAATKLPASTFGFRIGLDPCNVCFLRLLSAFLTHQQYPHTHDPLIDTLTRCSLSLSTRRFCPWPSSRLGLNTIRPVLVT